MVIFSLFFFIIIITKFNKINNLVLMIRYFKEHGWPSSTLFEKPPEDDESRANLIDTLQVLFNA